MLYTIFLSKHQVTEKEILKINQSINQSNQCFQSTITSSQKKLFHKTIFYLNQGAIFIFMTNIFRF